MKRGWKIFWIIVGSVAGLGIVLSLVAFSLGLTFGQIREAYPNGIGFVRDEYYDEAKEVLDVDPDRIPTEAAMEFENVTRLEMEMGCCEILILPGSDDKIRVDSSEMHLHDHGMRLAVEQDGETLSVSMTKNGKRMQVLQNMTTGNHDYGTLYLYLPAERELQEADLRFGAVEVEADILKAEKLKLKIGAADCSIDNLDAGDADISVGAGELDLTGRIRGNAELQCGVGEADLALEGREEDFDYEVRCGLGEVQIGDRISFGGIGGNRIVDNGSSRKMVVDCGVGSVTVEYE